MLVDKLIVSDAVFSNSRKFIILSTNYGYVTYNISNDKTEITKLSGSIGKIKIEKDKIIFSGGENNSFCASNVFIISDQTSKTTINVNNKILGLYLFEDNDTIKIATVLEKSIKIYDEYGILLIEQATYNNPTGIFDIAKAKNGSVIITCLGDKVGNLKIWNYTLNISSIINISDKDIQLLKLSPCADLVAIIIDSSKINIHTTNNGLPYKIFRRGTDIFGKTIFDISFSIDNKYISCSSSNSTVHIFSLEDGEKNKKSIFNFAKKYLPDYFSSVWAFKTIKVGNSKKIICEFDKNNTLHICLLDGTYYKVQGKNFCTIKQKKILDY